MILSHGRRRQEDDVRSQNRWNSSEMSSILLYDDARGFSIYRGPQVTSITTCPPPNSGNMIIDKTIICFVRFALTRPLPWRICCADNWPNAGNSSPRGWRPGPTVRDATPRYPWLLGRTAVFARRFFWTITASHTHVTHTSGRRET